MAKKYVDENGLKRALQKIKPYMGEGGGASKFTDLTDTPNSYTGAGGKVVAVKNDGTGLEFKTVEGGSGGGEAGRILLEDVNINEIREVNSYILKGDIDGLPDDVHDFIYNELGVDDSFTLSLDVALEFTFYDEEFDEEDSVVTQKLEFVMFETATPMRYERVCSYTKYSEPVNPEDFDEDGSIIIDDYTVMFTMGWKAIKPSSDYTFESIGRFNNCLSEFISDETHTVYVISAYYTDIPENMVIDDFYIRRYKGGDSGDVTYSKLSNLDITLRSNDWGLVHTMEINISHPTIMMGMITLDNDRITDFMEYFDDYKVWMAYRTNYEVID